MQINCKLWKRNSVKYSFMVALFNAIIKSLWQWNNHKEGCGLFYFGARWAKDLKAVIFASWVNSHWLWFLVISVVVLGNGVLLIIDVNHEIVIFIAALAIRLSVKCSSVDRLWLAEGSTLSEAVVSIICDWNVWICATPISSWCVKCLWHLLLILCSLRHALENSCP